MTFSIRTLLIVMALAAMWLAAMGSKSALMIEIAGGASTLLILIALPLAIWDSNLNRRPFWTGFFVVAVGTYLLMHSFGAFSHRTEQLANWMSHSQISVPGQTSPYTTFTWEGAASKSTTFISPYGAAGPPVITFTQLQIELSVAVIKWFPIAVALLVGGIGGWVTSSMSRRPRAEARVVENAHE